MRDLPSRRPMTRAHSRVEMFVRPVQALTIASVAQFRGGDPIRQPLDAAHRNLILERIHADMLAD
jgi:hypothetical protein